MMTNSTVTVPPHIKCSDMDFSAKLAAVFNGWPISSTNWDALVCSSDWWYVDETSSQLRQALWIGLFLLTIALFFSMSCFVLPRMNGRRDTTGMCGKLGNIVQDKLDTMACVLKCKRKRVDNWNGKLAAILAHFSSSSGFLDEASFDKMFSCLGDNFVDRTQYAEALQLFGSDVKDSPSKKLDVASLESIYSLGCTTWREKHVQVERDYERMLLLSGAKAHSDYLVSTGSLGSHGLGDVEAVRRGKKMSTSAAGVVSRAAEIETAAKGGAEFASAIDTEFSIEAAMTEAERFSVALPSLYVETWLFTLINAFLFLYLTDFFRWMQDTVYPLGPPPEDQWDLEAQLKVKNYFINWLLNKGICFTPPLFFFYHTFPLLLTREPPSSSSAVSLPTFHESVLHWRHRSQGILHCMRLSYHTYPTSRVPLLLT